MMRSNKKIITILAAAFLCLLVVSSAHAGCMITIKAQNSSGKAITIDPKMSKATLKYVTPRIWKKVFTRKDVKKKRNIIPAKSTNYGQVFKATNNCKAHRTFRFAIEQGSCRKSFEKSLGGNPRNGVTTNSLDLGDLAAMCR